MSSRTYIVSIVACVALAAALLAIGAAADLLILEVAGFLFAFAALIIKTTHGSARTLLNLTLLMLAVIALAFLAGLLLG